MDLKAEYEVGNEISKRIRGRGREREIRGYYILKLYNNPMMVW